MNARTFDVNQRILIGSQIGKVRILRSIIIKQLRVLGRAGGLLFAFGNNPPSDNIRNDHRKNPRYQPKNNCKKAYNCWISIEILSDPATKTSNFLVCCRPKETFHRVIMAM